MLPVHIIKAVGLSLRMNKLLTYLLTLYTVSMDQVIKILLLTRPVHNTMNDFENIEISFLIRAIFLFFFGGGVKVKVMSLIAHKKHKISAKALLRLMKKEMLNSWA